MQDLIANAVRAKVRESIKSQGVEVSKEDEDCIVLIKTVEVVKAIVDVFYK